MSDKIRKYVLPNLPYLFVFWFFSKIGTAYRIAPGTDFGTKLMGMLDTFPKAFETYWPGLGGIDLLVEGTLDRPVRNIRIEGLTFSYSTWMRLTNFTYIHLFLFVKLLRN